MNWIDENRGDFDFVCFYTPKAPTILEALQHSTVDTVVEDWAVWHNRSLEDICKDLKAQGTQEALAKVEHWIARYPKIGIDTTDLLHYLQQLKDNKTV